MAKPNKHNNVARREFELLIGPCLPDLYRTAVRLTGHREDAEDLVQKVLLKLFPRTDQLARIEVLKPWLTRILYREFIDASRARNRLMRWLRPATEATAQDQIPDPASSSQPEKSAQREQEIRRLHQALEVLNQDQSALIVLHDMEGYSIDEISQMLDIRRGTVKSRLHRARSRLRLYLGMEAFASAEPVQPREVNHDL